ncbi:MAG: dihydroorotate dehydrogenase electron transfer subunit [Planctomycetes bacterium]|nr:dihydroorotate dehydrogenase electron transfer subunit [Planctomycetota bacterium]
MSDIFDETATVESNEAVAVGHCRVRLHAPWIAAAAQPGQFVNVQCGGRTLLRRPFSFSRVVGESFEIVVRIIGEGTRRLSKAKLGDDLPVLGPLGRGFELTGQVKRAVMIGGGCGIGPLEMLGRALIENDVETTALLGCQNQDTLPLNPDELQQIGIETSVAVMTGKGGHVGPVTDLLEEYLDRAASVEGRMLFACGPWGMLRKVAELAEQHEERCQVLLEEMMGCGMGACMSCACEVFLPDGGTTNKKACTDGPMFWADEVNWNARD